MSSVITVNNLGKKYTISHQQREEYTALRDVITNGFVSLGKKLINPFCSPLASSLTTSSEEDFWALQDVSFEVNQGDRLGIIGRNGAGKSTLLKILSRITEPTTGSIRIRGRVASLLEVGTGFHPELTGRENIFLNGAILGMSRVEIKKKFDEIVDFAEIEKFLDTPVKRYSSGMYVRLAFAVAAHLEPEILIVDEVLAVGDVQFQKKCLGKMENVGKDGRTVLFVSHNMAAINRLCNKGILLGNGKVEAYVPTEQAVSIFLNKGGTLEPQNYFERIKSGTVQFISACVTDLAGNVSSQILDDQGFIIILGIESFDDAPSVYLGLILQDSEGQPVLYADSRDGESCMPSRLTKGSYKFMLRFPPILKSGIYSVTLGIASPDTLEELQRIEPACTFELIQNTNMQRNTPRPGLINLNLTWEPY